MRGILTQLLVVLFILQQCARRRVSTEQSGSVKFPPLRTDVSAYESYSASLAESAYGTASKLNLMAADCGEPPGAEVLARHVKQDFYPQLVLQTECITNTNFTAVRKALGAIKHKPAPTRISQAQTGSRNSKTVRVLPTAKVYIVYGFDTCRAQDDDPQDTVDDKSSASGERIEQKIEEVLNEHEQGKEKEKEKDTTSSEEAGRKKTSTPEFKSSEPCGQPGQNG